MTNYLFAVNPVSGKGKAKQKMKQLRKFLDHDGISYTIFETKPGFYCDELRSLIEKETFTHVFAVGGDGTAHEVLNAIVDLDVSFGVLPFGSGNDFARMHRIPKKIKDVYQMIVSDQTVVIDIGKANDRYFLNFVSFGLDAEVCAQSLGLRKYMPSSWSYLFGFLKTIFRFKPHPLIINGKEHNLMLATINNGLYYGSGMKINPFAKCDDGLLDLCVVNKLPKLKLLLFFPTVFFGRHNIFKEVEFKQETTYKVDITSVVPTSIDGEIYHIDYPVTIQIFAEKVRFIINSK